MARRIDIITTNTTLAHERAMTDASRDWRVGKKKSDQHLMQMERKASGYLPGYHRAWKLCQRRDEVKGITNGKS